MSKYFDNRDVGDTVRFESEFFSSLPFQDEENLTDAENITITIETADGNEVVDSQDLTEHKRGQYFFEWNTSGLDPVQYKVTVEVEQGDGSETTHGFIELDEN